MEYKYSLSKKGKSICPSCGKKTFVLYVDNSTKEPFHSTVGKCDRADNCAYHYAPKEYFQDNGIKIDFEPISCRPQPQQPQPSYLDTDIFKRSLSGYENNNLISYLKTIFDNDTIIGLIQRYFIGTSKHWENSTVFWQIDINGKVRAGKIMQYNGQTGKRIKKPNNRISWVHSVLKLENFNLSQCLFGEHLLSDKEKTVAVVESEKTAIIASVFLPDFIWLASGGSEGLSLKRCKVLFNRKVILFPDLGQFDKWKEKEAELSKICTVSTSAILEEKATEEERKAGFDIADYLTKSKLQNTPTNTSEDFSAVITRVCEKTENLTKHDVENKKSDEYDAIKKDDCNEYNALKNTKSNESNAIKKVICFISLDGRLYIPTPPDCKKSYTVYSSVEAYNNRSEKPTFEPFVLTDTKAMNEVFINLDTLKI